MGAPLRGRGARLGVKSPVKSLTREIRKSYEFVVNEGSRFANAALGFMIRGTTFSLKGLAGETGGPIRFFILRTVGKQGGFVRVEISAGSSLIPDRGSFEDGVKSLLVRAVMDS